MKDNTKKFSDKVENYVKYKPSYPVETINYFQTTIGINKNSIVADIGSGTGILTKLLNFYSVNGTAENTTLTDKSIDYITVAQAFHWFDIPKTLKKFKRILKPNGVLILLWNNRLTNTGFLKLYDNALIKYGIDHTEVNPQNLTEHDLKKCYSSDYERVLFDNHQEFDLEGS